MRKFLSILLVSAFLVPAASQLSPLTSSIANCKAQTQPAATSLKIGYFSYDKALRAMPDYAIVEANMNDLRKQYDTEMKNAEDEFNTKYETFLEVQQNMAKAIREKRQSELQAMLERNTAFRQESERLVKQAQEDALKPLRQKISNALAKISAERGLVMVVNTDSEACPYINPANSEDISEAVNAALK